MASAGQTRKAVGQEAGFTRPSGQAGPSLWPEDLVYGFGWPDEEGGWSGSKVYAGFRPGGTVTLA